MENRGHLEGQEFYTVYIMCAVYSPQNEVAYAFLSNTLATPKSAAPYKQTNKQKKKKLNLGHTHTHTHTHIHVHILLT